MRHLARIIVLWILIVSLPVQGIAAAIRLPCTMAHASAPSLGAESMDDCDDAEMTMPQAKAQVGVDRAHQGMPCDQGGDHKHSSCRACAACFVGASAPPPFAVARLQVQHFATHYIPSISPFTGWIPSRIERPPRA